MDQGIFVPCRLMRVPLAKAELRLRKVSFEHDQRNHRNHHVLHTEVQAATEASQRQQHHQSEFTPRHYNVAFKTEQRRFSLLLEKALSYDIHSHFVPPKKDLLITKIEFHLQIFLFFPPFPKKLTAKTLRLTFLLFTPQQIWQLASRPLPSQQDPL